MAALDFYEDLAADNSKTYWTAHKQVYDDAVRAPIVALAAELEEEFGTAKVFRPYRDVRFAKDKTPYKTAQGAFVGAAPGVGWYLQVDASGLLLAGGFYHGSSEQIARYRTTLDTRDDRARELRKALGRLTKRGYDVDGEQLKTTPRGFTADHPHIDLLRHKSLTVGRNLGCPDWLETRRTLDEVRTSWREMRPLVDWLAATVG